MVREVIANPEEEVPPGVPAGEESADYNCLFASAGGHNVLFDAGLGSRVDFARGSLMAHLASVGVGSGDVDRLVITDADGDHIGGILDDEGEPAFANARHVLWQGAWDYWFSPAALQDWPGERVDFVRSTYTAIEDRVDLVEGESDFLTGFRLVPAVGHKRDHVRESMEQAFAAGSPNARSRPFDRPSQRLKQGRRAGMTGSQLSLVGKRRGLWSASSGSLGLQPGTWASGRRSGQQMVAGGGGRRAAQPGQGMGPAG